jgi:hypothetical protein
VVRRARRLLITWSAHSSRRRWFARTASVAICVVAGFGCLTRIGGAARPPLGQAPSTSAYSGSRNDSGGSSDWPHPGASQATMVNSFASASSCGCQTRRSLTAPCTRTRGGPSPARSKAIRSPADLDPRHGEQAPIPCAAATAGVPRLGHCSGRKPLLFRLRPVADRGTWKEGGRAIGHPALIPSFAFETTADPALIPQEGSTRRSRRSAPRSGSPATGASDAPRPRAPRSCHPLPGS